MNRRTTVATLGSLLGTGGLAGCLGGSPRPDPVDLSGGKADDQGGMIIGKHGGPNGQIFYENESPAGHDNPAWFHTLAFGLFRYYLRHERRGWEATAIYVTDYSSLDYELDERDGRPYMPAPTAARTFGDATAMTYVVESEVNGGMGPELHPFSAADDARAFVEDHGGRTVGFDDVTPQLIAAYTSR
ncbi:nitrous oxide reductase accessory protein NosL [Haloplanus rubicundus]|uniref:Nitrous oxide reductase accessory protein NosL n=1 Tax=Haloplanus rubicundus TaxID=1547898 RepID=A0A345DZ57_9EURY|nr:nitrous oxide reductase accessory protein NosL [Haloplanus rubicundus]AXG05229.1 nitrous oxide reductase accessory protein NosL [Haloplanus rubicundus]